VVPGLTHKRADQIAEILCRFYSLDPDLRDCLTGISGGLDRKRGDTKEAHNGTRKTVKPMIRRGNRMKFADSQVTGEDTGLNGWFKRNGIPEIIRYQN
jgi:hypothetical protein